MQISVSSVDLTHLKVTFERSRVGLSDFIVEIRVLDSASDERVLIRASRDTAKDGADRIAKITFRRFAELEEKSFDWDKANVPYLAKMLGPHLKYFGLNPQVRKLTIVTDALK